MIRLKNIVQSIICEGPELMYVDDGAQLDWTSSDCIGPFIFFYDAKGSARWMLGDRFHSYDVLDTGQKDGGGASSTHGSLLSFLDDQVGTESEELGREDYEGVIYGRLWKYDGMYYVSTWNTANQIKSWGVYKFKDLLKDMIGTQFNGSTNNIIINPLDNDFDPEHVSGKVEGSLIPFKDFGGPSISSGQMEFDFDKKTDSEETLKRQQLLRQLHLMSPALKAKVLKMLKVPIKVRSMPDWQRRKAKGIDEGVQYNTDLGDYEKIGPNPTGVLWMWDGNKLETKESGVNSKHSTIWGIINSMNNFSGRFDPKTKKLSIRLPFGKGEIPVPSKMIHSLVGQFGEFKPVIFKGI